MESKQKVKVYLDDETQAFAEFESPVKFMLDTTKIPDGEHKLRIVAKSNNDVEGIQIIPFTVRNGPHIDVIGLKKNEVISDQIPISINAYGSEKTEFFKIIGSESPKAIPTWIWLLLVLFIGYGIYYIIMYFTPELYKSFV